MISIRKLYLAVVCATSMVLFSFSAYGQDSPGRFELGGSLTSIRAGFFTGDVGPGLDADLNIGRHLALDGSFIWFPSNSILGHTLGGLFGVKAGMRARHFGFFGKVRPGFFSVSNDIRAFTVDLATGQSSTLFGRFTERALDIGSVIEYYPSQHWSLRWDLGDTLVFREQGPQFILTNPPPSTVPVSPPPPTPGHTSNQFQFSTSVHYRF